MSFLQVPKPRLSEYSYLFARDSGIPAPTVAAVRTNLAEALIQEEDEKGTSDKLAVYLRIKKVQQDFSSTYKLSDKDITCIVPQGSNSFRNCKPSQTIKKIYSFSKIFNNASQHEIFNEIVKPKLLGFINGSNCSLFTYGASGSGKTFTIFGSPNDPGVIPRTFDYLFRTLPPIADQQLVKPCPNGDVVELNDSIAKEDEMVVRAIMSSNEIANQIKDFKCMQKKLSMERAGILDTSDSIQVGIWVSFAEIYNEQIFDLLQLAPKNGKRQKRLQLGTYNDTHYVKNLTSVLVKSGEEAYKVLHYGLNRVNYASTGMNMQSSRSHSIFTIRIVQVCRDDGSVFTSTFSFCDLAGSERVKNTKNEGMRLKESNNINSSLVVLGRCIQEVRNAQKTADNKVIPFRESKLTQLFQRALSGAEPISMIITMNPDKALFDENMHVLNFAAIAKQIQCKQERQNRRSTFQQFVGASKQVGTSNNDELDVEKELQTKQEEIYKLYEVIDLFKEERETMEETYEENQRKMKEFYYNQYKALLEKQSRSFEMVVRQMENKIKMLENKLRLMTEGQASDDSIIVLDSDEDAVFDDGVTMQKMKDLKMDLKEDRQKNEKMARMLDEAVHDYNELEKQLNMANDENLALKDRNVELEHELACYRNEMASFYEQREEGDSDEISSNM